MEKNLELGIFFFFFLNFSYLLNDPYIIQFNTMKSVLNQTNIEDYLPGFLMKQCRPLLLDLSIII